MGHLPWRGCGRERSNLSAPLIKKKKEKDQRSEG